MNKKVIIGVCCAVVVLLAVVIIAVVAGGSSPKGLAKKLGGALENEEKLEKFVKKNIDFKTLAAVDKMLKEISYDEVLGDDADAKIAEAFKKAQKEVSKEEINDTKEEALKSIKGLVAGKKLKVKECGKLENSDSEIKGLKEFKSMKVTYEDKDGKEYKYTLGFYKNKLIVFSPDISSSLGDMDLSE